MDSYQILNEVKEPAERESKYYVCTITQKALLCYLILAV